MSSIQSNVGLISGIPIQETVDQLMAISARPRDLLTERNSLIETEQVAVDRLSSLVLALQFEANALKSPTAFQSRQVSSSAPDTLEASIAEDGSPPTGSYQFTAVQTASNQQLISNGFEDLESAFSGGELSFRFGGFIDKGIELDALNSGNGIDRGRIRITDRGGATATIDLRYATTVDDVLDEINSNTEVQVSVAATGNALTLTDHSGGSGNLRVQEIAGGTTAASLGWADVDVASETATGDDVFTLHSGTKLLSLNDGTGVQTGSDESNDLEIAFRDESESLQIDLSESATLGDVIDRLNEADPDRLSAAISGDGNRIEITDLTTGGGEFGVASVDGGTAAEDLGIAVTTTSGTIVGDRLASGLRDVLISSLNGGQGISTLGQVDITNRNGDTFSVDLSSAETLGDVLAAINDQAAGITASLNDQRHGIVLNDTTGGSASNLVVANGDTSNTADALGIVIDEAATSVNSGTLNRQVISEATLLADLNGGDGVDSADIRITDSDGTRASIDLNSAGSAAVTVGDVLQRINQSSANVLARINDSGDGILIVDQAGGAGTLQVEELGNGAAAADLGILGTGVDNEGTQEIDGAFSYTVDLSDLAVESGSVLLSDLNNGNGIDRGDFIIESTELASDGETPRQIAIDLDGGDSDVLTVEQLIDRINDRAASAGISIEASINSAGTGFLLTDSAGGPGTFRVRDVGADTAAADLGFTAEATTEGGTQSINAKGKFAKSDSAQAGLNALATKINELDAGVTASTFFDGNGYRLSVAVDQPGRDRELVIDTGSSTLSFEEISSARDAILEIGTPGSGVVVTSSTNDFAGIVDDVDVTINSASDDPVKVDVTTDTDAIVGRVQEFVDAYNSIRSDLDSLTAFNEDDLSTGILFGTSAALRVDSDLSRVVGSRFSGLGEFDSLGAVGIRLDDKGRMNFDKERFTEAFTANPEAVTRLFTDETDGAVAKVTQATNSLAGEETSLLSSRSDVLRDVVEQNSERISLLDARLERERERLLLQFYRLEESISGLQQNLSALNQFQAVPPLTQSGNGALSLNG